MCIGPGETFFSLLSPLFLHVEYIYLFLPDKRHDSFVQSITFMLCSDIRYLILWVYILYTGEEITQLKNL